MIAADIYSSPTMDTFHMDRNVNEQPNTQQRVPPTNEGVFDYFFFCV